MKNDHKKNSSAEISYTTFDFNVLAKSIDQINSIPKRIKQWEQLIYFFKLQKLELKRDKNYPTLIAVDSEYNPNFAKKAKLEIERLKTKLSIDKPKVKKGKRNLGKNGINKPRPIAIAQFFLGDPVNQANWERILSEYNYEKPYAKTILNYAVVKQDQLPKVSKPPDKNIKSTNTKLLNALNSAKKIVEIKNNPSALNKINDYISKFEEEIMKY